jgi:hypothetical protein
MRVVDGLIMGAATLALVLAMCSGEAHAADGEAAFDFGPEPGWQLMAGPSLVGGFGSAGGGFVPGLELSLNRLNEGVWAGGYVDAGWDLGQDAALVTGGPQLGWAFVGLDGGLAARFGEERELGGAGRLLITFGFLSLHGRYIYLPGAGEHLGQVGVTFKLPLWAS